MLVIVEDPAGVHRSRPLPLDCSLSLHENVVRRIDGGADFEVWLNGERVERPEKDLLRLATVHDSLTLVRRPEGFEIAGWALAAIFVAAAVMVATMPRVNGYDSTASTDSPNNRLTGQTNIARTYEARPDVYGKVRCWPDLIQNSTFEYVGNVKRVTEWMCISRGRGVVSDFKYADTPIADIGGSSVTIFQPAAGPDGLYEHGTTTVTNLLETFDSPEVNGQELAYAQAWVERVAGAGISATTGSSTFTVTTAVDPMWAELISIAGAGTAHVLFSYTSGATVKDFTQVCSLVSAATVGGNYVFTFFAPFPFTEDIAQTRSTRIRPIGYTYFPVGPFTLPVQGDRIRWHYNFLRGLKGSVQIQAMWWALDAVTGLEIPGTRASQADTISADSYDSQYRTFQVTPGAGFGLYRVQFTRLSPQANDDGLDVVKIEEASIGRFYATKVLPGDTIATVTTTATTQATGYSERKFNCEFTRQVLPLSGTTHSASRNFARAIRHMWAVAGRDPDQLDLDSLAAINAAHGEASELLRFDYTFADKDMSLGERVQMAANHARCLVYRDGSQWVAYRDELRPLGASRQLDYRNLAASGESSIAESGHMPSSEDGVEVEYVNEDGKTKAYARLTISALGEVSIGMSASPKKFQLMGCRTTSQAMNRAHLEARKIIYQTRRVSDTALMDAASMGLGEVVRWVDPNDFYGDDGLQAGEVMAVSGTIITTSEPLHFHGEASGRIAFTGPDGRSSAQVTCAPRTDGRNGCIVSTMPPEVFVAADDRQCGSRYTFCVGLTDAELENAGLYVVESKKPNGQGQIAIELASYHPKFYEMD